jgi:hypothetical protein
VSEDPELRYAFGVLGVKVRASSVGMTSLLLAASVAGVAAVAGVGALGVLGVGCGSLDSTSAGVNAPCTRDNDCASGLTCQSGVCSGPMMDATAPPDAARDAEPGDGAGDG